MNFKFTDEGTPVDVNDFFEIKVYSLKLSKEYAEVIPDETDIKNATFDVKTFETIINNAKKVTADIVSNTDLLQMDTIEDTLYLPLPNSIKESISHEYDKDELNIGEMVKDAVVGVASKADTKMLGASDIASFATKMMNRGNIILDPKLLLVYKYTHPRKFDFSFLLMPQDEFEAAYYRKVVDLLKSYSKAEEKKILGFLPIIKQDKICTFNFGGKKNEKSLLNELMKTDDSELKTPGFFITSVNLSINSDRGYVQTFYDGMPLQMTLTLSFSERKPLYFNFWDDKQKDNTDKEAENIDMTETTIDNSSIPESTTPLADDFIEDNTIITNDTPNSTTPSKQDENIWFGM